VNAIKLRKLENIFQNRKIENPPKGFFTRAQLCKEWKVCEQYANRLIKKYVASGLMESKDFVAKSGMVTRPIPHYKIKNERN